MRTHNKIFYGDIRKIITKYSSSSSPLYGTAQFEVKGELLVKSFQKDNKQRSYEE